MIGPENTLLRNRLNLHSETLNKTNEWTSWKQCCGSGSGINIPDHISESVEPIFRVNIHKFFDAGADPDPGSGNLFDPSSGIHYLVNFLPSLNSEYQLAVTCVIDVRVKKDTELLIMFREQIRRMSSEMHLAALTKVNLLLIIILTRRNSEFFAVCKFLFSNRRDSYQWNFSLHRYRRVFIFIFYFCKKSAEASECVLYVSENQGMISEDRLREA